MSVSDQGELSKEWGDPQRSGAAVLDIFLAHLAGLLSGLLLGWVVWH